MIKLEDAIDTKIAAALEEDRMISNERPAVEASEDGMQQVEDKEDETPTKPSDDPLDRYRTKPQAGKDVVEAVDPLDWYWSK